MDVAPRFNTGSVIADLESRRKSAADTNFNDMMTSIDQKASDEDTLFGTIQKTGASVVAVGAIGKGAYSNFMKLKGKLSGKNDVEEGDEGENATSIGEEGGDSASPSEVEMTTFESAPSDVSTAPQAGDDVGRMADVEEEGDIAVEDADVGADLDYTPSFLQPTGATRDVSGGGGDEEAEDVAGDAEDAFDDATDAVGSAVDTATGAVDTASSAISGAISTATDAAASAAGAVTDVVGAATAAGADAGVVGATTALETAGAALDATGVGAPVGLILNIIGGLVLAGTMTAGIVGDVETGNEQADATASAQDTLNQATQGGMTNIAGQYAV